MKQLLLFMFVSIVGFCEACGSPKKNKTYQIMISIQVVVASVESKVTGTI
jgi:hypothetical protein